jgi:hypothetical protein
MNHRQDIDQILIHIRMLFEQKNLIAYEFFYLLSLWLFAF